MPKRCPHPDCRAEGRLIRWGRYWRWAWSGEERYRLEIQRVYCQGCGRTHALLPDFLHPYRRYVLRLLQLVMMLAVLEGLGLEAIEARLPVAGPALETIREWVSAFAYGAGYLLLGVMGRFVAGLVPLAEWAERPPPDRSKPAELLRKSAHFWQWGEILYARLKALEVRIDYGAAQFFPFLEHWLQSQGLTPRLFWSPRLATTPRTPFSV